MTNPSALYVAIESKLSGTLAEFVAERYTRRSWIAMSSELHATTGIEVSDETLRRWFADRISVTVKVA